MPTERTTSRKREVAPRFRCISSTRVFETAPVSQACQAGGGDRTADIYSDRRVALTISICSGSPSHGSRSGAVIRKARWRRSPLRLRLQRVAIPALTEAATASQTWHLPASNVDGGGAMCGAGRPRRHDRCAHRSDCWRDQPMPPATPAGIPTRQRPTIPRRTRIMDLGPRVRVQPTDVISGDRMIGRDPDPFIRGQILR